ncbi:MAG: DNA translocase FtsK [Prevotellaceae bacterium]|jgi:S-DNA-T family DNA segregation ATPase FtsK/SpoIIIE|nr:DNA translocase FtsK [Prevotellaceae bacterium]
MTKKTEDKEDKKNKKIEDQKQKTDVMPFILGLLFCAIGLYLFFSFFSYLLKWKHYLSLSPDNNVGQLGLRIARYFVNTFGLGALVVPVILFLSGLQILRPNKKFVRILLIFILGTVLLSVILTYLFHGKKSGVWLGHGLGGGFGSFLYSDLLWKQIGDIGTGLFLLVAIVAYSLFITPKTLNVIKMAYHKLVALLSKISFKPKRKEKDEIVENKEPEKEREKKETEKKDPEKSKPEKNKPTVDDAEIEIVIRNNEEYREEAENENETKQEPPFIPDYNKNPELNTIEIEEEYLTEESLTGELYDPTKDLSGYQRPPIDLLEDYKTSGDEIDNAELKRNSDKIVQILGHFKIGIEKIFATVGPTVTLYEIVPKDGIRIAQIRRLEDDIALRIAALGVRIIAPMPGKGTVGIEVPNENPNIVSMRSIIKSVKFQESKFDLPVVLGKTILGEVYAFDLAKMPHLLVAGATGQGKSVGLNAILTSLLYKKHPAELKIVMVDPKKVELTPYNKIEKHFLAKLPGTDEPIITDTQKVVYTLKSLCLEMDNRYDLLKMAGVRNVKEYNEKFINRRLNPLKGHRYMPYIVLVIDEFADLIMTAGREIEEPIARLAQLARAIGIHLVIATQRPTTNIITGLIKANFPARIAFRVTSMIDSRTILDASGANQLIGRGDMLVSTGADLIRVQCAFVDTPEVDRITDFIRTQPGYGEAYDLPEYVDEKSAEKQIDMKNLDSMFEEAAKVIVTNQIGSTSMIQRKLSLGYNRSGRIMDQLQAAGIVGPAEGSKPRQVLVTDLMSLDAILAAFKN